MRPQPLYTGTGPSDGLFTTARAVWAVVDNARALASHYGTTGSRFAKRGLRCESGKTRGAEPHTNGSRR